MFLINGELPWLSKKAVFDRSERLSFYETKEIKFKKFETVWANLLCT